MSMSRNIPDEVLFDEILVRLPVKSLTVYKSVCKPWLYAIESRAFREAHRRHHSSDYTDQILFSPFESVSDPVTKSTSLLPSTHCYGPGIIEMTCRPLEVMLPPEMTRLNWPDVEHDEEFARLSGRFINWRASVIVLGPLRTTGIYCVVSYLFRAHLYYGQHHCLPNAKISICNPATRDYKIANPFPSEDSARLFHLTTTQQCRVHYGFGVAADGDYKVVVVGTWLPSHTNFLSYVYSLKQGTWKKIVDSENGMVSRLDLQGKPYYPEIINFCNELCPQAFLNGCWHWMAKFSDNTCNLLSFNVDNDKFKVICGPPIYRGSASVITDGNISSAGTTSWVSVLNDHLVMLYHTCRPADRMTLISVWMMMEYADEESWINICTINLECTRIETLVGISYSLRENGNGGIHIDKILFQDWCSELVSCDEFGAVELQPDFENPSCIYWNNLGISPYRETLERL